MTHWCIYTATLLVILKLADLVTWSWWWILAPAWVPLFCIGFASAAISIARHARPHRRTDP